METKALISKGAFSELVKLAILFILIPQLFSRLANQIRAIALAVLHLDESVLQNNVVFSKKNGTVNQCRYEWPLLLLTAVLDKMDAGRPSYNLELTRS